MNHKSSNDLGSPLKIEKWNKTKKSSIYISWIRLETFSCIYMFICLTYMYMFKSICSSITLCIIYFASIIKTWLFIKSCNDQLIVAVVGDNYLFFLRVVPMQAWIIDSGFEDMKCKFRNEHNCLHACQGVVRHGLVILASVSWDRGNPIYEHLIEVSRM